MATDGLYEFHAGAGGSATFAGVTFPTIEWRFKKSNRLAEVTHSGSGVVAQFKRTIHEYDGSCKCVWDKLAYPEAVVEDGMSGTLVLLHGDSVIGETIYAIVADLEKTSNVRQGVVEFSFNFKGNHSANTTKPSLSTVSG